MELTAVFKKVPEGYIAWVEEATHSVALRATGNRSDRA